MKRTAVIMAGGSGERFYPLSRRTRPKQLLALVDPHKSMIEEAIDRVAPIIDVRDIFIVTSKVLQSVIRELLPEIPPENVIAEPYKRNTAPCLALAAAVIRARYAPAFDEKNISVAVLTADQFIDTIPLFREQVEVALGFAETHERFVTLGIRPVRPETGYGYIEYADEREGEVYSVRRFCEKPDLQTAQAFIASGNFLWNSGMFFYRLDTFINGLRMHAPEIGEQSDALLQGIGGDANTVAEGSFTGIDDIFNAFPDVSIDYALMEKASNVSVLPSRFTWDDVGSWDSLDRTNDHDEQGNVAIGTTTLIDTSNSIVANYSPADTLMLSVIGLDNVVVVATADSIVVCPKDRVQDVKKAVALMKARQQDRWL